MTDDHDRCEWVNVFSGTGSPGLSHAESIEPQNGCVCVCVCVTPVWLIPRKSLSELSEHIFAGQMPVVFSSQ